MPKIKPVKRTQLISRLREFGFEGPYTGGNHLFMLKHEIRLTLPNPHRREISIDLLSRILKQAGISWAEWLK